MSHHYSGPNFAFPREDARLDFTDLFAFPKPGDPGKSILIMDVHPSDSVNPPGHTTDEPFAPEGLYEIKIDTDGDAVANIAFQASFAYTDGSILTATLRRLEGDQAARTGVGGQVIVEGVPVSMGSEAQVKQVGDYRFFAGWRSDPFFFDVAGALNDFRFTGQDFFADKDICSIVLEMPNAVLGSNKLGLWARTLAMVGENWVQADRGARPSQTPFLTGEQNEAYRAGEPAEDAQFIDFFAHELEQTGGYTPDGAKQAAGKLLPDILYYNPALPASFPDNGRLLRDDSASTFLAIFTNGKVTTHLASPHNDFLAGFPYLGPPHKQDRKLQSPVGMRAAGAE
jgi:hypothetical protein